MTFAWSAPVQSLHGALQVDAIERAAALLCGEEPPDATPGAFTQRLQARWRELGGTVAAITDDVLNDEMNRRVP